MQRVTGARAGQAAGGAPAGRGRGWVRRVASAFSKRGIVAKEHVATREYAGTERGDAFNEAIAGERGVVRFGVGGQAHDKHRPMSALALEAVCRESRQ